MYRTTTTMKKLTHRCPLCHLWSTGDLELVAHAWRKHRDFDIIGVTGEKEWTKLVTRDGQMLSEKLDRLSKSKRPFDDIMFMGTAPG